MPCCVTFIRSPASTLKPQVVAFSKIRRSPSTRRPSQVPKQRLVYDFSFLSSLAPVRRASTRLLWGDRWRFISRLGSISRCSRFGAHSFSLSSVGTGDFEFFVEWGTGSQREHRKEATQTALSAFGRGFRFLLSVGFQNPPLFWFFDARFKSRHRKHGR